MSRSWQKVCKRNQIPPPPPPPKHTDRNKNEEQRQATTVRGLCHFPFTTRFQLTRTNNWDLLCPPPPPPEQRGSELGVCTGSRVPVLPVGTSGSRVQNSTRSRRRHHVQCMCTNSCNTPHVHPVCKGRGAVWYYHGNVTRSGTCATRGNLPEPDTRRKRYPTQHYSEPGHSPMRFIWSKDRDSISRFMVAVRTTVFHTVCPRLLGLVTYCNHSAT